MSAAIKAGDVAVCSRGAVGLITEDMPKWVTYKYCEHCTRTRVFAVQNVCTCEKGYTFVGVHLTNKIAPIGSPWASRTPRVVGRIDQFIPDEFPTVNPVTHENCFVCNSRQDAQTGHMCGGSYKTFAAEFCPFCKKSRFDE
jgi:hypothetical protein